MRLFLHSVAMFFCLLAVAISSISPSHAADDATTKAYKIKAAFIYNFLKFFTWPESQAGAGAPVRICLLGKNSFGNTLEPLTQKTVHDRPIVTESRTVAEPLENCSVLLIGAVPAAEIDDVIAKLRTRPTLTISEKQGFTCRGGIISFFEEAGRIRFEINPDAAKRANLSASSKLLELARIVSDKECAQ